MVFGRKPLDRKIRRQYPARGVPVPAPQALLNLITTVFGEPGSPYGFFSHVAGLAKKHGGEEAKIYTEEALERLYREYRLPPGVTKIKLAGYRGKLDEVAKEIEDLLGVKVEKEYHEEPTAMASTKTRRNRKAVVVAR